MSSTKRFNESLKYGQLGESRIAEWLKKQHYSVLPVYDIQINTGKGPQLFTPTENLIAPDMLAYRGSKVLWFEAKRKAAFAWHRMSQAWTTGIDLKYYQHYCKVADKSPFKVWLLFLQEGGQAKDSPQTSPSGLYGNSLEYLRKHESHRHTNWGKHGMVYWDIISLKKIAALNEL